MLLLTSGWLQLIIKVLRRAIKDLATQKRDQGEPRALNAAKRSIDKWGKSCQSRLLDKVAGKPATCLKSLVKG